MVESFQAQNEVAVHQQIFFNNNKVSHFACNIVLPCLSIIVRVCVVPQHLRFQVSGTTGLGTCDDWLPYMLHIHGVSFM